MTQRLKKYSNILGLDSSISPTFAARFASPAYTTSALLPEPESSLVAGEVITAPAPSEEEVDDTSELFRTPVPPSMMSVPPVAREMTWRDIVKSRGARR